MGVTMRFHDGEAGATVDTVKGKGSKGKGGGPKKKKTPKPEKDQGGGGEQGTLL